MTTLLGTYSKPYDLFAHFYSNALHSTQIINNTDLGAAAKSMVEKFEAEVKAGQRNLDGQLAGYRTADFRQIAYDAVAELRDRR